MDIKDINNQTQDVLDQFYGYVAEKNSENIVAMLAENVDWYIVKTEEFPWSGRLKTKLEIATALNLLFDAHVDGHDQLTMDHIFVDGADAAVFGIISRKVKQTGKVFTTTFCQRFTIKGGKITKFLMLEDLPEILKAY